MSETVSQPIAGASSKDNYDILLEVAKDQKRQHDASASDLIPEMHHALRARGLSPDEVREKIRKDCRAIWSWRTILKALPHEAKNPAKQRAGLAGAKARAMCAAVAAAKSVTSSHKGLQGVSSTTKLTSQSKEDFLEIALPMTDEVVDAIMESQRICYLTVSLSDGFLRAESDVSRQKGRS
jgi:hypothetical protein